MRFLKVHFDERPESQLMGGFAKSRSDCMRVNDEIDNANKARRFGVNLEGQHRYTSKRGRDDSTADQCDGGSLVDSKSPLDSCFDVIS